MKIVEMYPLDNTLKKARTAMPSIFFTDFYVEIFFERTCIKLSLWDQSDNRSELSPRARERDRRSQTAVVEASYLKWRTRSRGRI